eukprot:gene152-205_t
MATEPHGNIIPINIVDEMRTAYIDYSMSIIIARALPDVRDGLKPVHRRVLYGMHDLGITYNKPFKKSARIVGEVLGKYHPHGDGSVYDAMVRMAQDWSLRYPLVQGQGNFGSIDGDDPAAMRYTEARLSRVAEEMLADLNKDTVDFQANFDDSLQEPTILPAKLPSLLVNGSSGIAVGMATNMPPHNLSEVIAGTIAYIDNPEISIDELMQYIQGPDFPTKGIIYGTQGIREAYRTGKGKILMRARAVIETTPTGKEQIIVTEIPYMVNKAMLIERTAQLVNEKKIEGISDIRDESDKEGLRIVYDLKKDAISQVVLNTLYKNTALQSTFGVNNVALVAGRPQTLNLKEIIQHFVDHRHHVLLRRTQYELNQANKRLHILAGYLIALDHLDAIIALIRSSADAEIAKQGLMQHYALSEAQAKAILELRLQRLTGMERNKITQEHEEITKLIGHLQAVLEDRSLQMGIIKDELNELNEKYGDARQTIIEPNTDDITLEDLIAEEDMVITISQQGYIKRTSLSEYRTQNRGGVGARSTATKEDDHITHLFIASTHHYLLIFTMLGKVFWKKVYTLPEGSKSSKGRAIQNLIPISPGDQVQSVIKVRDLKDESYVNSRYILMCTLQGVIKKTPLNAYINPRTNGIHAININEGDRLLAVSVTKGDNHVIMALRSGRAIHFHEKDVRSMGRVSTGVRGVTLAGPGDRVVGMVTVYQPDIDLLVVSEKGAGKRSAVADYRITKRGGKGVITLNITEKTGPLAAIEAVTDQDELLIINTSGIAIRIAVNELRVMGRNTQGVRLIRLNNEGDIITSIAKVTENVSHADDIKGILREIDQQAFEQAQTEIDACLADPKNQQKAHIWYYRGVVYDQLMRNHITEEVASTYLQEAIRSYQHAAECSHAPSQYHSFAQINLRDLHVYYLNRGVQYYELEAFDEALAQLAICHQILPPTAQTLLYSAIIAQRAAQVSQALQYYEQYLQAGYSHPTVYQAMANLTYASTSNVDQAVGLLQKGIQAYPWQVDLLFAYCQLLIENKQLTHWEEALQKQLEIQPTDPLTHHQLAVLYVQSKRTEQAMIHYQRACALAPDQLEPAWQLARLYYNQGIMCLNQVAGMKEEEFQQVGQAKIKEAHTYLEGSLPYFLKSAQLSPKNLSILQPLYTLYTQLSMKKKANQVAHKMKHLPGGRQLLALYSME